MSNIVTFEQAVRLRNLGYNIWSQFSYYKTDITFQKTPKKFTSDYNVAPTVSEALDYLREEKGIICFIQFEYYDGIMWYGTIIQQDEQMTPIHTESFDSYKEAESPLLTAALDYLEKKGAEG